MTITGAGRARLEVEVAGQTRQVTVEPLDDRRFAVSWDEETHQVEVTRVGSGALLLVGAGTAHGSREVSGHELAPGEFLLGLRGRLVRARASDRRHRRPTAAVRIAGEQAVSAPMPGRVVRVLAETGEAVSAGQGLAVVEAMKMENVVATPADGVVSEVRIAEGDTVKAGAVMMVVSVKPEGDD